jgi:hypothetical protein
LLWCLFGALKWHESQDLARAAVVLPASPDRGAVVNWPAPCAGELPQLFIAGATRSCGLKGRTADYGAFALSPAWWRRRVLPPRPHAALRLCACRTLFRPHAPVARRPVTSCNSYHCIPPNLIDCSRRSWYNSLMECAYCDCNCRMVSFLPTRTLYTVRYVLYSVVIYK